MIVTDLRRADHGELEASVSVNGGTVPVTRRYGSWGTLPDGEGRWSHLVPSVAAELQDRARRFEKQERSENGTQVRVRGAIVPRP